MSAIIESQPGDTIVCIMSFVASPDGVRFSKETRHAFEIGEQLRYRGARLDDHLKDQPTGWKVLFETADGTPYTATQTYFVTEDAWQRIAEHFAQKVSVAAS